MLDLIVENFPHVGHVLMQQLKFLLLYIILRVFREM